MTPVRTSIGYVNEWGSRIIANSFARVTIPIAIVLVALARIVRFAIGAWTSTQFNPGHVYVACFVAL